MRALLRALFAAVVGGLVVACGLALPGAPDSKRPACADLVAQAITSTRPVAGAYACMVENGGAALHAIGVSSDDSWAQHNATGPHRPPFVFETRLRDGAYVYRMEIPTQNGPVVLDLLIWLAGDGSVYSWVVTGMVG